MLDPQDVRVTSYLPHSGHGAGGMMVGMTTSGMIVHHIPTGIGVSCDSERSQYANKEKALKILEKLVKPELDWEALRAFYYARQSKGGYCRMGDNCVCGGDFPEDREGCFEWKSM